MTETVSVHAISKYKFEYVCLTCAPCGFCKYQFESTYNNILQQVRVSNYMIHYNRK